MAVNSDPRVVQLNFPGTLRRMPTPAGVETFSPDDQAKQTPACNTGGRPPTSPTERKGPIKRDNGERVDWEAMEPHYRGNQLSMRQLGEMFGCRAPSIVKHAAKFGWTRDLTERINAKADELVNAGVANAAANAAREANTAIVVRAVAEQIAAVRGAQRERFSRAAELYTRLFVDLEEQVTNRCRLHEFIKEYETTADDAGLAKLLGKQMREAIALPEQIKAFKDLATIGAQLTAQELAAYKLDKAPEGGEGGRIDLPVRFVGTKWIEQIKPKGEDE